jgi:hypothetical protein
VNHTCSKCRYAAKPEENFWQKGVLYRTCNLHPEEYLGDQLYTDVASCASSLRTRVSAEITSSAIEPNDSGISFHLDFTGIVRNTIAVPCAAIAKQVACEVKKSIEGADGVEYRYMLVCGSTKSNDFY